MKNARRIRLVLFVAMFAVVLALLSQAVFATVLTNAHPMVRVTKKVDNAKRTTLGGHVPRAAQKATDLGRLPGNTPMNHLIMVLQADPEQEHELRTVLDQQHDKKTANFHQWLKPEEFGERFGVHDSDIEQVKNWLTSQGLSVEKVSKGKRYIQFSGASAQVETAFNTEMHYYQTPSGEVHISLSRDISVPEALSPVIRSVPTLHNFFRTSNMKDVRPLDPGKTNHMILSPLKVNGDYTSGSTHYVGAGDFATIYNLQPLFNSGINGQGVTIGIIARTDILLSDVQTYKNFFNLPNNDPNFIIPGQAPGIIPGDDEESDLDVDVSGASAPLATIDFIESAPTLTVDGVDLSALYAVESNSVDIISESYGQCEADLGTAGNSLENTLWEQAAAQGISVFVSSGDNGPASCDLASSSFETFGYSVSGLSSTPFNVSVGGTYFVENGLTTYWGTAITSTPPFSSALSYIPEMPWDQARGSNEPTPGSLSGIEAGSSGISAYYMTPSWQRGPGVPSSDPAYTGNTLTDPASPVVPGPHRYLPDVALNASSGHDPTFFCTEGICQLSSTGTIINAGLVGGTSVAAPSMAGIQALVNQYNGGRQGNPNYHYYALAAAQNTASCASSPTPLAIPAASCVFNDVTTGNNLVCDSSATCSSTSTNKIGWTSGVGYDLTTGLGSPNAYNLATMWNTAVFNSSVTTFGLGQTTGITHGSGVSVTVNVAPGSGSGTPTGDVSFIASAGTLGNPIDPNTGTFLNLPAFGTLSGGTYTGTISDLPAGTYNVVARYGGDTTYASSVSAPIQVTVTAENSGVTITPNAFNQSTCVETPSSTFNYGDYIWFDVAVAGVSGQGVATGTVSITDNGNPFATAPLSSTGVAHFLSGAVPSSSCVAGYTYPNIPTLSGGVHNFIATYSGDGSFNGGPSASTPVTVNPITDAETLAAAATTITSGFADQLTLTFTNALTGYRNVSSAPTGTVTFTDTTTSTPLGTATVVPTVTQSGTGVNATYAYGGYATTTTTGITGGTTHTISAVYSGDSNYSAGSSSPVTVTVGGTNATTTAVTSNGNPTTLNGRPTFTATISGTSAPTSGAVTFYDGTAVLGAGSAVGTAHTSTFRPAAAGLFALNGGTHNITATYAGIAANSASTSPVFVETVTKSTTVVTDLTVKNLGSTGQNFTFACVLGAATANYPYTANVQFFDGGTPIGSAAPLLNVSNVYNLWDASFTTTLSAGTHTITAQYVGDTNYNASALSNAQTVTVGTNSQGIYSPVAGSTLANTATTFKWYPGATSYWVDIGKEPGGNEYYQSGAMNNLVLSLTVPGADLPTDGSTVYVRFYYLVQNVWSHVDSTYTAFGSASQKGVITSPVPTSMLSGSSVVFTWSAGTGATAYWIDAGSSAGGSQYFQSGNLGNVLTKTVTGLPTDGSTVYVTLYSLVSGSWLSNAYTYTAFSASGAAGILNSPTPGSTLTSSSVTFGWSAGAGATAYWLDLGSTAGGNQYYQSGNLGNVLSTTASGLPTDGSTIYATLYSLVGGSWTGNAYTYTALNAAGGKGVMQTPIPGSTLSGSSATFTWSAGTGATAYWVDIGNVVGGNQYYQSGNLGNVLTTSVSSLPADGSTIYVTLYSLVGGQWLSNAYAYTSGP